MTEGWGRIAVLEKIREDYVSRSQAPDFLTTPPKRKNPFFGQLIEKKNSIKEIKLVWEKIKPQHLLLGCQLQ